MRKKIKFNWELIAETPNVSSTERCQVYGGWLVHVAMKIGKEISTSMVFVPDNDHGWVLMKDIPEVVQRETEGSFT